MTASGSRRVTLDEYVALCNDELRRQHWYKDGMRFQKLPVGSTDPSGVDYVCPTAPELRLMVELDARLSRLYDVVA